MRRLVRLCALSLTLATLLTARAAIGQEGRPPTRLSEVGEAPLSLTMRASAAGAPAGAQVEYTIVVASARPSATVEVQIALPQGLEPIGADGCSAGSPIVCRRSLSRAERATITISARVADSATPGSALVARALAQDDQGYTASSGPISVSVSAPPAADSGASAAAGALPQRPPAGGGDEREPEPSRPEPRDQPPAPAPPMPTPTPAAPAGPPQPPQLGMGMR